jgi:undecaprenyl diphosphate synthase
MNIVPGHIAVIMDGNGRWARQRGLPRVAGHRKGVDAVRDLVRQCLRVGVGSLTLFAFSSENWNRPKTEVSRLVELLISTLESEVRRIHENGMRLRVIGDVDRFGPRVRKLVSEAEALTAANQALNLTVAVNYGGRWDIIEACRGLCEDVRAGNITPDDIDEAALGGRMSTASLPEPDLFIRTGGEQRISNFLLWQLAYTELYFTNVLWPDFDAEAFREALQWYASRERRFGRTGEQIAAHS